ncbi:Las1-domain-containing protein [Neolentinus lepideus HHB14362 ss-1]|uniref:Las1-domain-containing protein n=1 Tax=Neolentinus lepideus HHB14362 ss-1 TaxID=1314782 RepID=A0A165RGZ5_9AGAM|nr:Las1-domain-containing protein [Neolentinus lepideus HHB14362 ss-1]
MRLPRRVPWANVGELEQVCSWVYDDENDLDSKQLAIHRLSAWKSITSLPHALESTLAILTALQQDNGQQTPHGMALRHMYAAAIIRLVNGLVDPLQSGAYARSISSIAQQLGLPPWLVELRHAATHEDMPSLELLREAARESMSWLLHNYFLPTLNPSTAPPLQSSPLTPVDPILKQYKKIMKILTRDTSLATRHKADVTQALRDLERWLAEAKLAENVDAVAWGAGEPSSDALGDEVEDPRERRALDRLLDDLVAPGGLVPLAKRKRTLLSDSFQPPASGLNIWATLLKHVQALHPTFYDVAASRIVSQLSSPVEGYTPVGGSNAASSYYMGLARWAMWFVQNKSGESGDAAPDLRKEDVVVTLITNLGLSAEDNPGSRRAAQALLQALCEGDSRLEEARALFLRNIEIAPPSGSWQDGDINVMNERLNVLLRDEPSGSGESSPPSTQRQETSEQAGADRTVALPRGWGVVDNNWKPCPIGVFSTSLG